MSARSRLLVEATAIFSALFALNISIHRYDGGAPLVAELNDSESREILGGMNIPPILCADCDEDNAKDCEQCVAPPDSSCQYIGVDSKVTISFCIKLPQKVLKGLAGKNGYSTSGAIKKCKLGSGICDPDGGAAACGSKVYAQCNKQQPDEDHENEWCKGECEQSVNAAKNCS